MTEKEEHEANVSAWSRFFESTNSVYEIDIYIPYGIGSFTHFDFHIRSSTAHYRTPKHLYVIVTPDLQLKGKSPDSILTSLHKYHSEEEPEEVGLIFLGEIKGIEYSRHWMDGALTLLWFSDFLPGRKEGDSDLYTFGYVDGDCYGCVPAVDSEGELALCGCDWQDEIADDVKTLTAYRAAASHQIKTAYNEYIVSDEWKARRKQYLISVGLKCEMCGSAMNLNVHHIRYDNLGCEKDDDLIALCRSCHEKVHVKDIERKWEPQ